MLDSLRGLWQLLKDTYSEWRADRSSTFAAALSFYTLFSLGPLLLIVTAMVGLVYGQEAAQGEIRWRLQGLVGAQAAEAIETMIRAAYEPRTDLIATALGVATLLFGATRLLIQLEEALNALWRVRPGSTGLRAMVRKRLLALLLLLGIGLLALASLVLMAVLAAVEGFLGNRLPGAGLVWQSVNLLVSFALMTVLFAMVYELLPEVEIAWKEVWLGAAATSLLFALGQLALGLYLGIAGVGLPFGAAGSLVVLLVWIYYSAQVFLFGAEFTRVYALRNGSRAGMAGGAGSGGEAESTTGDRA